VLSGTNVTRLKTHLLNFNACKKLLQSLVAAELTTAVKEVKAALLVCTPKASGSEHSLTSSYRLFQVRTGTEKVKVCVAWAVAVVLEGGYLHCALAICLRRALAIWLHCALACMHLRVCVHARAHAHVCVRALRCSFLL